MKRLSDEILDVLAATPEERAALEARIGSRPELVNRFNQSDDLYSLYSNETLDDDNSGSTAASTYVPQVPNAQSNQTVQVNQPTQTVQPTQTQPVQPVQTVQTQTVQAPPPPAADNSAILSKLGELSNSLNTRLAELSKQFVPTSELPRYRTEMLASAIKASDDYATIREDHRAEFGKPLDRTAFEKYVSEQTAAGARFSSMKAAHDAFVQEDRLNLRIARGVEEGIKTRKSAQSVPAQTTQIAMSPAQQVLAKARETASNNTAGSQSSAAAARLAAMVRARESAGAVS